jgi:hypothetical protein
MPDIPPHKKTWRRKSMFGRETQVEAVEVEGRSEKVLIEPEAVSPSSQVIGDFIQKTTQGMVDFVYVPIEVYGPKIHDLSLTLDETLLPLTLLQPPMFSRNFPPLPPSSS